MARLRSLWFWLRGQREAPPEPPPVDHEAAVRRAMNERYERDRELLDERGLYRGLQELNDYLRED